MTGTTGVVVFQSAQQLPRIAVLCSVGVAADSYSPTESRGTHALQVIVYGEYESAATPTEHRTAILVVLSRLIRHYASCFPVIGDRTDDQRRVRTSR